jgi:hypothetical protein
MPALSQADLRREADAKYRVFVPKILFLPLAATLHSGNRTYARKIGFVWLRNGMLLNIPKDVEGLSEALTSYHRKQRSGEGATATMGSAQAGERQCSSFTDGDRTCCFECAHRNAPQVRAFSLTFNSSSR